MKAAFEKVKQTTVKSLPQPANDGKTHLNFWIIGRVRAFRILTQGERTFSIPELGEFETLNDFILYVLDGPNDEYRFMTRQKATRELNRLRRPLSKEEYDYIKDAFRQLLLSDKSATKALIETTLPFDCYYVHKNRHSNQSIPVRPIWSRDWICMATDLREEFKNLARNPQARITRPNYQSIMDKLLGQMEAIVPNE